MRKLQQWESDTWLREIYKIDSIVRYQAGYIHNGELRRSKPLTPDIYDGELARVEEETDCYDRRIKRLIAHFINYRVKRNITDDYHWIVVDQE